MTAATEWARVVMISGIDGAGKSTVIDALQSALERHGFRSHVVWLRYNHYLSKSVLAAGRLFGLTRYESEGGYRLGYHHFYRSRVLSWCFITTTFIDTLIATLICVHLPLHATKRVIVCDRAMLDILVDLEIDTHVEMHSDGFVYRLFMALAPAKGVAVILERERDLVTQARPESRFDRTFARRWLLYRRHGRATFVHVVRNEGEPDAVAWLILRLTRTVGASLRARPDPQ